MSGVLDRMAQRALGTLPAVRPPMAPRYTETLRPTAAELEMTAETEAIVSIAARKSDARERLAVGSEREAQAPENTPIGGRRILNSSTTRKRIDNAPEQELRLSAPDERGRRQLPPIERGRHFAAEHSEAAPPEAAQLRLAEAMHRDRITPTANAVPHIERMEPHSENSEPMREQREASKIGSALIPKSDSVRPEISAHSDSPKSSRSVAPPPLQIDRRGAPQREPRPAQPVEETTEIHISIGSIELRAPHVESRPQAAPFRPRVTLDDFLRRGQETRP